MKSPLSSSHSLTSSIQQKATIESVKRKLRRLHKHKSKLKKSEHLRLKSQSRSRSQNLEISEREFELDDLRRSVKALKCYPQLSDFSDSIHSLSEFISSPKRLLSETWSAIGLDELLNLVPLSILDSCKRRERRWQPWPSRLSSNWPPLPSDDIERGLSTKGLADLWCRCLDELEQISPTELHPIMQGEKDPFSVSWTPRHLGAALIDQASQTTDIMQAPQNTCHTKLELADSTTNIVENVAQEDVQREIMELEMRARAIRSLLEKTEATKKSSV